jgi:hypothetical protein
MAGIGPIRSRKQHLGAKLFAVTFDHWQSQVALQVLTAEDDAISHSRRCANRYSVSWLLYLIFTY